MRGGTKDRTARRRDATPRFGRRDASSDTSHDCLHQVELAALMTGSCLINSIARNLIASAIGIEKLIFADAPLNLTPLTCVETTLPNLSTIGPPLLPPCVATSLCMNVRSFSVR